MTTMERVENLGEFPTEFLSKLAQIANTEASDVSVLTANALFNFFKTVFDGENKNNFLTEAFLCSIQTKPPQFSKEQLVELIQAIKGIYQPKKDKIIHPDAEIERIKRNVSVLKVSTKKELYDF